MMSSRDWSITLSFDRMEPSSARRRRAPGCRTVSLSSFPLLSFLPLPNGVLIHTSIDPDGFRALLNSVYKRYKKEIYVTENGFSVRGESNLPLEKALEDTDRVAYFRGATDAVLRAINEDGVDIRSYFPWSECLSCYSHST